MDIGNIFALSDHELHEKTFDIITVLQKRVTAAGHKDPMYMIESKIN